MRAAVVTLVAAALFFAGAVLGSAWRSTDPPNPGPVVIPVSDRGNEPEERPEPRNAPPPQDLDVEEVEHQYEEGYLGDYDADLQDRQEELQDRREDRQEELQDRREEREDDREDEREDEHEED